MPLGTSDLDIIFVNNCFAIAGLVIICYDYMCKLDTEIKVFWSERNRLIRIIALIYFAVRLTSIVGQLALVLHLEPWKPLGSAEKCQIAVHIGDAVNVINGVTCAVFTVLRAKALSKRWWIVVPLVALACLLNPALFLAEAFGFRVLPVDSLGLDQCVGVLGPQFLADSKSTYLVTSITATVGDVATCVLVIHYFIQYSGETRIRGSLANTLLWDAVTGLMTIALNMLVNVILVVVFDSVYDNPKIISLFRAWAILYPVVSSINISHFILELQESAQVSSSELGSQPETVAFEHVIGRPSWDSAAFTAPTSACTGDPKGDDEIPSRDPFPMDPETGEMASQSIYSLRHWEAEFSADSFPSHFYWGDSQPRVWSLEQEDSSSIWSGGDLVVEARSP